MEPLSSLAISLVVALVTSVLGLVTSVLSKRRHKEETELKKSAEDLAAALTSQAEASRAKTLELLAEKLPQATDANELLKAIEALGESAAVKQIVNIQQVYEGQQHSPGGQWSIIENLVNEYHRQALDQAKIQFWFSVVAATVGFAWIIYAGSLIELERLSTSLKSLPGIVIEAVAVLFFRQAAETRQRATELYDRLRSDTQHANAVSLVESIEDIKVRSAVKAQLSLHMAGLNPQPIDLSAFLGGGQQ